MNYMCVLNRSRSDSYSECLTTSKCCICINELSLWAGLIHTSCEYHIVGYFCDQTPTRKNLFLRKFLPPQIFLLTSRVQYLWAPDPVNRQVEEPSSKLQKVFTTYGQLAVTANRFSVLAPFGVAGFCRPRPTHFDKCGNLTIVSMLKIHAMGHHFQAGNCRGCDQTLWPCRENKIAKSFSWCVGDPRKFMLANISRYMVLVIHKSIQSTYGPQYLEKFSDTAVEQGHACAQNVTL